MSCPNEQLEQGERHEHGGNTGDVTPAQYQWLGCRQRQNQIRALRHRSARVQAYDTESAVEGPCAASFSAEAAIIGYTFTCCSTRLPDNPRFPFLDYIV